ncbi:MAG: GTP-binding protein [Alphaproteobacteria bacterium]|nr:GTP-binding protein [Alphaproteobacteria bacterium]
MDTKVKIPVPITVLTGFLGSGKTTLLKALLGDPAMAGTAVIVNEFGEVGIDDALIEAAEEETVLLPSGCVCCAVRGDLVAALQKIHAQAQDGVIPALNRVVLETSGLADPAPIAHTLMTEEDLFRVFQLDGIITTVDAELIVGQLEDNYEPAKQIAVADRLVLTKTDRASPETAAVAERTVRALNPAAELHRVVMGEAAASLVTTLGAFEPIAAKHHAEGWLSPDSYRHDPACEEPDCHHHDHAHDDHDSRGGDHHHHALDHKHTHGIRSFAIDFDVPLDASKLSFVMELLRAHHGDRLLRVKAIVNVKGEPLPFVVHGVQHMFYPPTTLDAWPGADRRSRFVFITKDLDEATVRTVLNGMFAPARPLTEADWAPN